MIKAKAANRGRLQEKPHSGPTGRRWQESLAVDLAAAVIDGEGPTNDTAATEFVPPSLFSLFLSLSFAPSDTQERAHAIERTQNMYVIFTYTQTHVHRHKKRH